MVKDFDPQLPDRDAAETLEWQEAIGDVLHNDGPDRASQLLSTSWRHARALGTPLPALTQTPYVNSLAAAEQPVYPGDLALESRLQSILRWNAVMMVLRANRTVPGIGGHLSTYASSAYLYEVGFNHFFRGPDADSGGDALYYQGHATPGLYARAFLEGRLSAGQLDKFRQEIGGGGLSSYPHPWLMPELWQFPTVSMGLGPLHAIYHARFNRYLHNRGLKDTQGTRVWAFLGDGECDEVETLGALGIAAREGLDNLTFVINCNLQRLDGPVRGNGKIIQELESVFHGAGWNVIKCLWGPEWDPLLAQDEHGLLVRRLGELVDGQFQKYLVTDGALMRQELFGGDPRLLALVEKMSDAEIAALRRGGHCPEKVYAAYDQATRLPGPTCILAKSVKGWLLGQGFEGSNVTHQMKKLDAAQVKTFRDRLDIPVADADLADLPYYHPGADSPEIRYMQAQRAKLGGPLPQRRAKPITCGAPAEAAFKEFFTGGKPGVEVSTTMAFVRLLRNLLRDKAIGRYVVPIVPDEARTFGMDAFFREFGIYAPNGQKYVSVDSEVLLHYHESQDGQMLEEGITEAGSMASFIAAGTAHAINGVPTIPFYMFYSMFGLQRTGDQVWAAGDARTRGFLLGATAGRTTLHGEGLQHNDGHSQLFANAVPNLYAYDPAYAYESAVIVREGLRRMLVANEDVFYYLTLYNENIAMPPMPAGAEEGILRGLYRVAEAPKGHKNAAQLLGSGPLLPVALLAQRLLAEHYDVGASVYSATSYQQLYRDARACERHNRLHPLARPRQPYVTKMLPAKGGPAIAVSDWVQELPSLIARFVPGGLLPLGANGFGRSDGRDPLRRHFEIDAASVVVTTLYALQQAGKVPGKVVAEALKRFNVPVDGVDPMLA